MSTSKDPLVQYVGESLQQSFNNGFELARIRILRILSEELPEFPRQAMHRIEQLGPEAQLAEEAHPSCSICRRDHGPEIVHECE